MMTISDDNMNKGCITHGSDSVRSSIPKDPHTWVWIEPTKQPREHPQILAPKFVIFGLGNLVLPDFCGQNEISR